MNMEFKIVVTLFLFVTICRVNASGNVGILAAKVTIDPEMSLPLKSI